MSLRRSAKVAIVFGRRALAAFLALTMVLGSLVTPSRAHASGAIDDGGRTGATSTPLPAGSELLVGGQTKGGVVNTAEIIDHGIATPLIGALTSARVWHTATMLPDGRVLVHGGLGASGRIVIQSGIADPTGGSIAPIVTGISPRAYHTATLLTSGDVLIVGGMSAQGDILPTAELWDPKTGAITIIESQLSRPRAKHTATLLADGRVLIAGGVDAEGATLSQTEIFDPAVRAFDGPTLSQPDDDRALPATLAGSMPSNGAVDVAVDVVIALRFSRPLRVDSLKAEDIVLSGPKGSPGVSFVPAEAGRLVFVAPVVPLLPQSTYALTLHGLTDTAGLPVAPFTIEFITSGNRQGTVASAASGSARNNDRAAASSTNDNEGWIPTAQNLKGDWTTGWPNDSESGVRALPPLQAPPGITALAGQVVRLNGQPLSNVTLQIDRTATRTDPTGRFLLTGASPGVHELIIDGRSANAANRSYGRFAVNVELKQGVTEVLRYTIWMPQLDTAHAVSIPNYTTSEVVVTTPLIPGLELRLPPHSWIRDDEGKPVTELTITPIPLDRPPFPLPEGVQVPLYFTIQPGGAYIYSRDGRGAQLVYPNSLRKPPYEKFEFWDYDAERKGWYIYGLGTVTANAQQVMPDPGVAIYELSGAMVAPPSNAPAQGPPAGTTGRGSTNVDLATGLFVYQKNDLFIRDTVGIALTRTYRPQDSQSRAFGIGATHPYEMFLVGNSNPYTWIELVLADGGRVHFDRISSGTGYTDAVFEHTTSPTAYYKARIAWNGAGWNLTFKNGTVYVFTNGSGYPLSTMRDRYGNALTITRQNGTSGRVTRITTTPNARWADFTYDGSGRITQITDVIGRTITYGYDSNGRLASVTDAAGGVTQYTYDVSHRMLTLRDPRGITFLTNEYDINSRATRQTRADASTYQFAYTVDGTTGKITQTDVTAPGGDIRRVIFNSSGYVMTNTRALGTTIEQTTTYERQTGTNLLSAVVDPLARRLEHTYDAMGNIVSTTRLAGTPDALTTTFTYEPMFNNILSVTTPVGQTMTFAYDIYGNVSTAQDPLGNMTTFTYNTSGQRLTKLLPGDASPTSYGYDFGDLTTITDPLGNQTRRFIDGMGRTAAIMDPLSRVGRYDWDAVDRLVKVTDPLGGAATMSYDGNDNLLNLTDPARQIGGATASGVTNWAPDTMDRLDTRTDPLGRAEHSTYDAAGNLISFSDRKGQVTTVSYDALNRPTQITYQDGSTTSTAWNAANRLTQIVDSISGTIIRAYDALDRLTNETTPQGSVDYSYDVGSRRTTMTAAGQPSLIYSYDNANRLTQITQGTSMVTYNYDAAGRRTSVTLPNGVRTEYTYDAASRVTGITYKRGETVLGTLTYAYDGAGRRTETSGTWARTGLPGAPGSAIYDGANRQVAFAGEVLTYDLNGSLVSQGDTTYEWDARGRLVTITGSELTATFQYDPFGRRTQKTINGSTTSFVYDGVTPVQEMTAAGIVNLLTGRGIDEYLARTDTVGRRLILTDILGSSIALTDDTGTVTTEYTYDPFGTTTALGETSANSFRYTGREDDGATGLYYYRSRYYSAALHRFLSEDTIDVTPWDTNLYAYVGNDPIGFVDPFGEAAITAGAVAEIAAYYISRTGAGVAAAMAASWAVLAMIVALFAARDNREQEGAPDKAPNADGTARDGGAKDKPANETSSEQAAKPTDQPVEPTIGEILKGKKGSIKQAPLPSGSPSWEEIMDKRLSDIKDLPGFPTIRKLLTDKRFNK